MFPITVLDIDRIHDGLSSMSVPRRAKIRGRAAAQVASIERRYPRLSQTPYLEAWADREIDQLVQEFQNLPCPALEADGGCGIYPWRPITCRLMGIPTDADGIVQGACQVQTAVPIIRIPDIVRRQADALAEEEARILDCHQQREKTDGEEVLLPYGFLHEIGIVRDLSS